MWQIHRWRAYGRSTRRVVLWQHNTTQRYFELLSHYAGRPAVHEMPVHLSLGVNDRVEVDVDVDVDVVSTIFFTARVHGVLLDLETKVPSLLVIDSYHHECAACHVFFISLEVPLCSRIRCFLRLVCCGLRAIRARQLFPTIKSWMRVPSALGGRKSRY